MLKFLIVEIHDIDEAVTCSNHHPKISDPWFACNIENIKVLLVTCRNFIADNCTKANF